MSYHRALGMPHFSPYGWEPNSNIGMHHIDYVREPVRVLRARRTLASIGQYESDAQQLGESGDGLGGILAVL